MSRKQTKLIKEKIEWFRQIKNESECVSCGENDSICLEFHHLNSRHKKGTLSQMVRDKTPFHKVKQELKKCVPLCANCHKKVHAGVLQLLHPEFNKVGKPIVDTITIWRAGTKETGVGLAPRYPFH